jgi:hypothetical protein
MFFADRTASIDFSTACLSVKSNDLVQDIRVRSELSDGYLAPPGLFEKSMRVAAIVAITLRAPGPHAKQS